MEVYVPEETSGCLYHIWRLVTSPPFENFILFLIVLNTLLLMMKVRVFKCTIYMKERSIFLSIRGKFAAVSTLIYIWRYYLNWKKCWFLRNEVISIPESRNSYFTFSAWYFWQFGVSYRILKNKKQKNVSESALKTTHIPISVFGVDNDNTFGAVVVVSRCRTHKQN